VKSVGNVEVGVGLSVIAAAASLTSLISTVGAEEKEDSSDNVGSGSIINERGSAIAATRPGVW